MELLKQSEKPPKLVTWYMCSVCSRAFTDMEKMFDHKYSAHPEFAKLIAPAPPRPKPKRKSKSVKGSADVKSTESTGGAGTSKITRKATSNEATVTVTNAAVPKSLPKSKIPKALSSNPNGVPKNESRKKLKLESSASYNPEASSIPETSIDGESKPRTSAAETKAAVTKTKVLRGQGQSEVPSSKLKCTTTTCDKLFDNKDLLAQHVLVYHQFVIPKEGSKPIESMMKPCALCGRKLSPSFKCIDCPNKEIILHHPLIKQEPLQPELSREENAENVAEQMPTNGKRRLRSSSVPDHSRSKLQKLDLSDKDTISPAGNQPPLPKTPEKHVLSSSMVPQVEERKPVRATRMNTLGSPRPPRTACLNRRFPNMVPVPVNIAQTTKKSPPNFVCTTCGKNFNSKSNLVTHERAHQLNESSQSFAATPLAID